MQSGKRKRNDLIWDLSKTVSVQEYNVSYVFYDILLIFPEYFSGDFFSKLMEIPCINKVIFLSFPMKVVQCRSICGYLICSCPVSCSFEFQQGPRFNLKVLSIVPRPRLKKKNNAIFGKKSGIYYYRAVIGSEIIEYVLDDSLPNLIKCIFSLFSVLTDDGNAIPWYMVGSRRGGGGGAG